MATLTKKRYLTQKARLEEELAATTSRLATLDTQAKGGTITCDECDEWNALYDYTVTVRSTITALEEAWETRHWTAADWASQRLMALNID